MEKAISKRGHDIKQDRKTIGEEIWTLLAIPRAGLSEIELPSDAA